jgi:hypothetical protein
MDKFFAYLSKNGSIPATLHPDTIKNLCIGLGLAACAVVFVWGIVRKI